MVVIIKYYLVDSENVNDNWLMLLDLSDETDKIIVFYTKNSPHMSYSSVIWVKCSGTREYRKSSCELQKNRKNGEANMQDVSSGHAISTKKFSLQNYSKKQLGFTYRAKNFPPWENMRVI